MNTTFLTLEQRYKKPVAEILDLFTSPGYKTKQAEALIDPEGDHRPFFFVICGVSGSGKTVSIDLANAKLGKGNEIAESNDLLWCHSVTEVINIIQQDTSLYADSKHIAYVLLKQDIGNALDACKFCPIIFL